MFEPALEIFEIMEYVGNFQRPFVEGTAILNAKHLIECGLLAKTQSSFHVFALCIQTSCLLGKPHEINIKILRDAGQLPKIEATCTCKAGSGKCKHIVAVMLYLNRQSLENLEVLSCTDTEQQWGKVKVQVKAMYEPEPCSMFCHVKPLPYTVNQEPDTPELKSFLRNTLLSGAPESALAVHYSSVRATISPAVEETPGSRTEDLRASATDMIISSNEVVIESIKKDEYELYRRTPEEVHFFKKHVYVTASEAVQICLDTQAQCGAKWLALRKPRVTGSRCYELFTYSNNKSTRVERNWEAKLNSMIFNTFQGNAHTSYGINNEANAIKAYMRQTLNTVDNYGLIINHNIPWVGYSPDGIVHDSNKLIEAKCLAEGKTLGGLEMASKVSCLTVDGENVCLKKKHKYYGQVQLGMLVCDLRVCDFLVYSKAFDECVIVEVKFDVDFCRQLLSSLRETYFHIILPFLTANQSKLL